MPTRLRRSAHATNNLCIDLFAAQIPPPICFLAKAVVKWLRIQNHLPVLMMMLTVELEPWDCRRACVC